MQDSSFQKGEQAYKERECGGGVPPAASHRRRPAAVYLGFLQSSTAETVVFLGRFLDIFVMVRKNLRVHALMNVFLRNESDE